MWWDGTPCWIVGVGYGILRYYHFIVWAIGHATGVTGSGFHIIHSFSVGTYDLQSPSHPFFYIVSHEWALMEQSAHVSHMLENAKWSHLQSHHRYHKSRWAKQKFSLEEVVNIAKVKASHWLKGEEKIHFQKKKRWGNITQISIFHNKWGIGMQKR